MEPLEHWPPQPALCSLTAGGETFDVWIYEHLDGPTKHALRWQTSNQRTLDLLRSSETLAVLVVSDGEIAAPKFVSAEERAKLEALRAEEEARAAAAAQDNLGERGLQQMMNGTLETRREEDELFVELVRPEWMETKPPDEMSEEEKQAITLDGHLMGT